MVLIPFLESLILHFPLILGLVTGAFEHYSRFKKGGATAAWYGFDFFLLYTCIFEVFTLL